MANLEEFMKECGIKRIDFDAIEPTGLEEEYGTDELICPYCGTHVQYEGEETDEIIRGTVYQCPECERHFNVEAEVSINTTCKPLEDYLLEPWVRRNIEGRYAHDDECDSKGMDWDADKKYSYIEWQTYKEYAEPLFENMKKGIE